MDPQDDLQRRAAKLYDAYRAQLPGRLTEIMEGWKALLDGSMGAAALDDLAQQVHRLCGSGPTFGLPEIARALGPLDEALRTWRHHGQAPAATTRERVREALLVLVLQARRLAPAAPAEVDPQAERALVAGLPAPPRILLADDDDLLRQQLALTLRAAGCTVDEAADGAQALAAAGAHRPDVVLMNYRMPVMDGAEAVQQLRARPELADVLVYLVTTARTIEDVRAVLTCEVDGYLAKPLAARDVLQRVAEAQEAAPPPVPVDAPRVLVADDDAFFRQHLALTLRRHGFETDEAHDGLTALKKARAHDFDLVLFDVLMPVLDGFEATRFLRREPGGEALPVVLITAQPAAADVVRALSAGADAYIAKPDAPALLVEKIRTMIGARESVASSP